jgi:hypothetical protein
MFLALNVANSLPELPAPDGWQQPSLTSASSMPGRGAGAPHPPFSNAEAMEAAIVDDILARALRKKGSSWNTAAPPTKRVTRCSRSTPVCGDLDVGPYSYRLQVILPAA